MQKLDYEKLTIYEVDSLKETLLQQIGKQTRNLELNIVNIQKIDMAAIQLLLSAQKTCQDNGFDLVLHNASESVKESLKICACEVLLGSTS